MSALTDDTTPEVIKVLFALYDGFDALDFVGPLEVLTLARHNVKDPTTEAFDVTFAAPTPSTMTRQGAVFQANITTKEAHDRLSEFDVLIVPGGITEPLLQNPSPDSSSTPSPEPIPLIQSFVTLQQSDPSAERTLMSICTGSHLLAKAGALQGMAATTHPDHYITLEKLCQQASAYTSSERTDVMEHRYIVNNARFDLGDVDENPFVVSREEEIQSRRDRRRSSNARKGSFAFKESKMRRESNARRAQLRLGGLRVITSGAPTSGLDAALYLVCAMVSVESAEEVARVLEYTWVKGVVVDSIDV